MSMYGGKNGLLAAPLFVALAVALSAFGCGVKSTPVAPELVRPQQILDLHAQQVRGGVQLSWSRPRRYASGKQLSDLGGFIILRATGFGPMKQLAEVPVTDQERFRVQSNFALLDTQVEPDRFYRYQVISRTLDDYQSLPSNEASVAILKLRKPAAQAPGAPAKRPTAAAPGAGASGPAAMPSPGAVANPALPAGSEH